MLLCMIVGCEDKKIEDKEHVVAVDKISDELDYVLVTYYKDYKLSNGDSYKAETMSINLDTEEMSNLSMTLKNNIYLTTKEFKLNENNEVTNGSLISYKYYESDKYISIIEEDKNYFNNMYGNVVNKTYVINKTTGEVLDNDNILSLYKLEEQDIYDKVKKSEVEEADYVVMYIKNNGYLLYINDKDELVLMYDYVSDEEEIKKELILVGQEVEREEKANKNYVVKKSENKYTFSFFDEHGVLSKEIMFQSFHSPNEFESNVKKGMSFDDVVKFDLNYIMIPASVVNSQVHILNDGIALVFFDFNHYVSDIHYYNEDTYKEMVQNNELPGVPYICVDDRKI